MSKNLVKYLLVSLLVFASCSMGILGETIFASENNNYFTGNNYFDNSSTDLHSNITEISLQRGVDTMNFNDYVYMQNKLHGTSRWIPSMTKIWQVKYKNGKKYQGYVNWTGRYKNGTHIGAYYQYTGLLFRA
ncbi:MAG: hypothetical protein E6X39_02990 [Enterococcus hirae]|nr:hypothetical protein [Enterococcus hirae]